jgi:hypothetical protein
VIENSNESLSISYTLQKLTLVGWVNLQLSDVWKEKLPYLDGISPIRFFGKAGSSCTDSEKAKTVKTFLNKSKYLDDSMYELIFGYKPIHKKVSYLY